MIKLEKLIKELCPDGVEYKKTSDLCNDKFWLMPATPKYIDRGIPYLTSKNIRNNHIDFENVSYISEDDYIVMNKNRTINKGDLLITMIGTIGEAAFVKTDSPFYGQNMYLIRLNNEVIEPMFYYYYLTSERIKEGLISKKNPASQGYIKAGSIDNLQVPVPPLEVQREIVRILDNFTELTAELMSELELRKKQYSELSYQLLIKKNNSKLHFVKDLCELSKGKTPIQKAEPGDYPLVVTTSERKSCKTYQYDTAAVCIPLVSSRGHGVASLNHVYYQEGKFALGNILCAVVPTDENVLSAKYLYFYFECTKDYTLVPLMKGGANVSMHIPDIEKVKIPIPDIETQHSIVSKLEILDEYCNITLPAEIEARQKQYEYYRDKLLTFKELSV